MTNQIPLFIILASKNPMSIAAKALIAELKDAAKEHNHEMTEKDSDSIAIGFMHGCGFFSDTIVEILCMDDVQMRESLFERFMTRISDERLRLSKQAAAKLDEIMKKEQEGEKS